MKRILFFLFSALILPFFISCDDDFKADALDHLNDVKSEMFSLQDLYEICHNTTWNQTGSYLEGKGYTHDGVNSLNRNWNKYTDYNTLRYVNEDSIQVSFNVNAALWHTFGGHAWQTVYFINDKIADNIINQKFDEFEKMSDFNDIKDMRLEVDGQRSTYYTWDAAKNAFLSSWDPGTDSYGYKCYLLVYTSDMIYTFLTYSKGDYLLGRAFNVRFGATNRNEM